ncbi:DUF397 domain-containing protein [Actinoallomurus acaciae]|uniref:DUF397 domain-containing protein n=1 Tax=Actinoallomurus acaciae TaxID=502577 RepID=A0ABV5YUT1_9ACTN
MLFVDGADVPVKHKHDDHMVVLRDADNPDGDALYYTPNEWEAFVLGVKDGEFDDLATGPGVPMPEPDASNDGQSAAFPWTGRPGYPVSGGSKA